MPEMNQFVQYWIGQIKQQTCIRQITHINLLLFYTSTTTFKLMLGTTNTNLQVPAWYIGTSAGHAMNITVTHSPEEKYCTILLPRPSIQLIASNNTSKPTRTNITRQERIKGIKT